MIGVTISKWSLFFEFFLSKLRLEKNLGGSVSLIAENFILQRFAKNFSAIDDSWNILASRFKNIKMRKMVSKVQMSKTLQSIVNMTRCNSLHHCILMDISKVQQPYWRYENMIHQIHNWFPAFVNYCGSFPALSLVYAFVFFQYYESHGECMKQSKKVWFQFYNGWFC